MSLEWQALRGHVLVCPAVVAGVVGMGLVFSGVMDANVHELSRGVPPLPLGLWWAGWELARSMQASRVRHTMEARRSESAGHPAKL